MPGVGEPILTFIREIVTPILAALGSAGGLYALYKLHWEGPRVEIRTGDLFFLVGPVGTSAPINATLVITNRGSRAGVLQFLEAHVTMPDERPALGRQACS